MEAKFKPGDIVICRNNPRDILKPIASPEHIRIGVIVDSFDKQKYKSVWEVRFFNSDGTSDDQTYFRFTHELELATELERLLYAT